MAKRKKSKKHPQSEQVAKAPAPDANDNAAPPQAESESLTADPPIAEASTSALAKEIPPQAGQPESGGDAAATEAEPPKTESDAASDAASKAAAEASEALSTDAPAEEAVATHEETEESVETADAATAEAVPADTEESPSVTPEQAAADETSAATSAEATDAPATTLGAETSEPAQVEVGEGEEALAGSRLEAILESLLFASDKPLGLNELKRLLGERDGKKVMAAVDALTERRKGTGIEVAALSSGWHLRTNPESAAWVAKLLVGRPVRLSRAMLETLAIVAYRQPVTRPEVDDIRGVDCGPVLKTLLDRGLVRIIGKKEEVGRPMLYGTTPEFLRIFNLRDLSELPTLREFYDLSTEDQSRVEAEHGPPAETPSATTAKPDVALNSVMRGALQPEPDDTDPLLDELDEASQLAKQALGELEPKAPDEGAEAEPAPPEANSEAKPGEEPPASPATE